MAKLVASLRQYKKEILFSKSTVESESWSIKAKHVTECTRYPLCFCLLLLRQAEICLITCMFGILMWRFNFAQEKRKRKGEDPSIMQKASPLRLQTCHCKAGAIQPKASFINLRLQPGLVQNCCGQTWSHLRSYSTYTRARTRTVTVLIRCRTPSVYKWTRKQM